MTAREVAAKIVFYGPGLSGKTTTLRKIYESVRPANRGEMMSLATEGDRTLFFDFLPVKVERVGDCSVRLALYTVPGQVFYNATRKLVLQGADGVVFVADSQPEAMDQNRESLANLEENLAEQGIRLDGFPLVFQWNKRDLTKALPADVLREALNRRGAPDFETCAPTGKGVLDALKAITRLVIKDLQSRRVVPPAPGTNTTVFHAPGASDVGLTQQLQKHLERTADLAAGSPRGVLSTLAPRELLDYARAAETAFQVGDYGGCIRACCESVRRGLGFAGEGTVGAQAHLLRVDGTDVLRLQTLWTHENPRPEDAAFALFVSMQVFYRLAAMDLPSPS